MKMNTEATLSKFFARVSKLPRAAEDRIRSSYERSAKGDWGHADAMACWSCCELSPSLDRNEVRARSYASAKDVAPISWAAASACLEILGAYDIDLKRGLRDFYFLPFFDIKDLSALEDFIIP